MVTMAVLSLMVSLCLIPINRAMQRINLNNTANLLQSELRLIQVRAVAEGQYYEIRFDVGLNRYRLFRGSERIKTVRFEPGISYDPTRSLISAIRYYPTGAPSSGATIALLDSHKNRKYVIITPAIGRVRVSEEPPQ